MKLFYAPGACSLAPHIVIKELGKDVELVKVDLAAKKTETGEDFNKVNPKSYVPALKLDNGEVLTEVSTVVQYLADQAKATNLLPAPGTMPRYRAMELLNFISSELHKTVGALFNKALPDEAKKIFTQKAEGRFDYLNKELQGKQYLLGNDFSVADAYCFTVLSWTKYFNIDLGRWPNVKAYVERVAARPAVQSALKAEGLA